MQAIAVIDERKAKRICRAWYPGLVVASTVDLLALDSVTKALGEEQLAEATYNALSTARMRVLPEHIDWVVNLIGAERTVLCTSLPAHVRAAAQQKIAKT
jgi:hypothetical protein